MNAKRLVILHLILALSVVCLFDSHALLYPSGTFDFATLNTKRTLEANHIIVGEVTDVSFVFERESYSPSSLVTVQIDKDIKNEIERLESQEQNTQGQQVGTKRQEPAQRTVTFVQVGGPWRGGGWVKVAGFRVLKVGDYVFLRLMPVKTPFEHDGHTINSGTSSYATIYNTKKSGNNPNDYVISKGWQGLDINVLQMTRVVRATLKSPDRIRNLERRISGLRNQTQNSRTQTLEPV